MLQPCTVEQATESARLQKMVVEALVRKQRQQPRGVIMGTTSQGGKGYNKELVKGSSGVKSLDGPSSGHTMPPQGGRLIEQRR